MTSPKRIQLSRAKGWRKPEGAVVVARPSRWGNPYRVQRVPRTEIPHWGAYLNGVLISNPTQWSAKARQSAVDLFQTALLRDFSRFADGEWDYLTPLRGHDLACWCPLKDAAGNRVPCHADVLLEVANS